MEHGHDVHGHGATVSSGHEHRREEEEGEGTYSISVEKWQQVVDKQQEKKSEFSVILFIPVCNVLVPHQSVEHGHGVHGHGAAISSGHEHSREEEGEGIYCIPM